MEIWFVGLLRAAWVAAIFPILVASIPSPRLQPFHETLLLFSGRGKTLKTSSRVSFYTAEPLSLCADFAPDAFKYVANQAIKAIVKSKHQMPDVEFRLLEYVIPLTKLRLHQWVGAVIFLWGSIHQHRCHSILGQLREGKEKDDDYVIPHGDWFELVSSPHYLAELVIYAGVLIASGGTDLTLWLMYGFVVANLVVAAAETHRWYRRKFDNYPSERYAIIPYVY